MDKVLIIEDMPSLRNLLAGSLKQQGYEVILAENSNEGVAQFLSQRPDVTVLDLMPGNLDGCSVLKALYAVDPKKPVVIFTGAGQGNMDEALRALGGPALIQKKISLHRLEETLDSLLHPFKRNFSN